MKKTEMHVHTAPVSVCAKLDCKTVADKYVKCGFDAVQLTNHYSDAYLQNNHTTFEFWLDEFIKAYYDFKKECSERGIETFFGAEVTLFAPYSKRMREKYSMEFLKENYADYLLVGVSEKFLRNSPRLCDLSLPELYAHCQQNGVLLFQAHPYRACQGVTPKDLTYLDGYEINGNSDHLVHENEVRADEIISIVNQRGKITFAGGDIHYDTHRLNSATFIEDWVKSEKDLVEFLKKVKTPKFSLTEPDLISPKN
ncbi:MAG: hypothetical protein IJY70_01155 [Clostridia bacterium]|nr:hypothetical protein [Clostridia bacterium]